MAEYSPENASKYWDDRLLRAGRVAVLGLSDPDVINAAYEEWEMGIILNNLPDIKGKRVLDLACGVGRVTHRLLSAGAIVTGVDVSSEMLNACRAGAPNHPGLSLIQCSADNIPCGDESFDVVVCVGLLEHIPDAVRYSILNEILRVLSRTGESIIACNNSDSIFLNSIDRYSMTSQQDNGYFCSLVDKERFFEFLSDRNCRVKVLGTNPYYSFARHMIMDFGAAVSPSKAYDLMAACSLLDEGQTGITKANDHYIIRVRK